MTKQVTFQILFTSDIHGVFHNHNYATGNPVAAGFSRVATLMEQDRKAFNGTTVICDCGDSIQGNGTGELVKTRKYQPFPLFSAFDEVGYDFVTLGNHEFNFGLENMYAMFEGYKGAKLCGNVFDADGNYLKGFEPYFIKQIPDGPRVAFIGMVSPNIDIWDAENTAKANIHTADAAQATKEIIAKLEKENLADIFIAVEHMDEVSELNKKGSGAKEVIQANPGLALFLGAHFHKVKGSKDNQYVLCDSVKFAENLDAAASYGRVLITATLEDGKWQVKRKTGSYDESDVKTDIIVVTENTPVHPGVEAVTREAHEYISHFMRTNVIGWLSDAPMLPPPAIAGTHEGVLGSNRLTTFISKVMFRYSGADIVAIPMNSYMANCDTEEITSGSISQMYVYDNNTMYKVGMTGAQLLQWMEWAYAFFGTSLNGKPAVDLETDLTIPYGTRKVYLFDQFFGLDYTVDLTKPAGQRIEVLSMKDGEAFDPEREYEVATTNYRATTNLLMQSDDGIFKPGQPHAREISANIKSSSGAENMLDLIAEYIKGEEDQTIRVASEDNWEFINLDWKQEWRDRAIGLINSGELKDYTYTRPVTVEEVNKYVKEKEYAE